VSKTLGKTMKKQHPNACGTFNSTEHQESKMKTPQKPLRVSMCAQPKTRRIMEHPLERGRLFLLQPE
jgi:hypothetical protein